MTLTTFRPWKFHLDFESKGGHLSIKGPHKNEKFCGLCCHKMQGTKKKLTAHLKAQHDGHTGDFLKWGEKAPSCQFTNFEECLLDPHEP